MQDAISAKLVQIISDIKDANDDTVFADVVDYDRGDGKYDQWPVAMVLPDQQPGDYGDSVDNDRREGFFVYIMLPLEDAGVARAASYQNMRNLSDYVRNAIDHTQDLDALKANDNLDRVLSVVPASAGWDIIDVGNGQTLLTRVQLVVRYSHNYLHG